MGYPYGGVEGLAPVSRFVKARVEAVDRFPIPRIGVNAGVIKSPLAQFALLVGALPGLPGVVGAENAPLGRLHDGPDPVRVCRGNRYPDLTDGARGHARVCGKVGPGVAPVDRFPQFAVAPAAPHLPGLAVHLPGACVQHLRVAAVDDQVDGPCFGADVQHLLPGISPVGAAKDSALFVFTVGMPEGGHIHDVGVCGVDADTGHRLGFPQPQVPPGLSAVRGFVHPVALGDAAPQLHLAHADVYHIRVGFGHGHRPHRGTAHLPVRYRRPLLAPVSRFPEPAPGGPEIVFVGAARAARGPQGTPAPVRADIAPFQAQVKALFEYAGRRFRGSRFFLGPGCAGKPQ